jgi:hypothetical protein
LGLRSWFTIHSSIRLAIWLSGVLSAEFIEWRAFSYWLRLTVETQGSVTNPMIAVLRERCPGFLEYAQAYATQHPGEAEFLWLRFLEWTGEKLFHVPIAEGWRHAFG